MTKTSEPSMHDVLARVDADAETQRMASAIETLDAAADEQDSTAVSAVPTAPFVYNTETVEVSRTFVNQIDRLSRLVGEDDTEIAYVEKERDRELNELHQRFEAEQQAIIDDALAKLEIVNARRADRVNARGAVQKVIELLQETK